MTVEIIIIIIIMMMMMMITVEIIVNCKNANKAFKAPVTF